jgi:flagellar FliJ protein
MKRFKFRLQKVLDVKDMMLKKVQRDLAFVKNQRLEAEEKLIKYQYEYEQFCIIMYRNVEKNVSEIKREYSHFYQFLDEIDAQKKEIAELDKKVEKIRNQLINAQRDQKILSKLKDKYYESFVTQEQREEQVILDEMSIIGINNSLSS